jgi:hypothetical protein
LHLRLMQLSPRQVRVAVVYTVLVLNKRVAYEGEVPLESTDSMTDT